MCQVTQEQKTRWWHGLSRHPLVIALFSTLIFGGIVAGLGSWFQHTNWVQEHMIATRTSIYEKIYDKRAEIVSDIFYYIVWREQNCWNIFSTLKRGEDYRPHWYKVQEIVAKHYALIEEMKIYFNDNDLIKKINEIHSIWHNVEYKIVREDFSKKGKANEIEKFINEETEKVRKLTSDVQSRLGFLIYRIDTQMEQMVKDIINTE